MSESTRGWVRDPQFVDDPHGGQTQPNPKEKQCKTSSNHRQAQVAWACKMVQIEGCLTSLSLREQLVVWHPCRFRELHRLEGWFQHKITAKQKSCNHFSWCIFCFGVKTCVYAVIKHEATQFSKYIEARHLYAGVWGNIRTLHKCVMRMPCSQW